MLAATFFMSLVLTYTNRTNLSLKLISDNKELINRMNDHKDSDFPFSNKTTKSKFVRIIKAYNISTECTWVSGNQDQYKAYHNLDTYAQFNIDADCLAGDYQLQKETFHPLASILPSCPAMVSIRGISVTSNIYKNLV